MPKSQETVLEEIRQSSSKGCNPELAAFLSLLVPGLGQIYLKQYLLAVTFFLPSVALSYFVFPWIIGMSLSTLHAYLAGHKKNGERSFL